MSGATGLGPLEVAVLEALERGADGRAARHGWAAAGAVLADLEARSGIGSRYAYPVLVDLAAPWRVHLPLVDVQGNIGTAGDDPPAEPRYVEVRPSAFGRLALAAERGDVGPVPFGLVEGSAYRDGTVPPFAPHAVVEALRTGTADAGPPVLPTGGLVEGDVEGLLAGRRARVRLCCRVVREVVAGRPCLVVTEVPLGVSPDRVVQMVAARVSQETRPPRPAGRPVGDDLPGGPDALDLPDRHPLVRDVRDESSGRTGTRLVVVLAPGADPVDALAWLRDVWPVTSEVDWQMPAPQAQRLHGWDAGDGSGLTALADLLGGR